MSQDRLNKTIARFQSKIDSGSFYEAHQTLRTITNRYVKSKQYIPAIDLLYQGASILVKNKEYASAYDLTSYLIQVYNEGEIKCNEENKEYKLKLMELISGIPNNDPSLKDLSKQSIAWSQAGSDSTFGDAELHSLFGSKFLKFLEEGEHPSEDEKQKLFSFTELHLILGNHSSTQQYLNYLFEWYLQSGANTDPGLFLSRAVLNYAYLNNHKFVKESINVFLQKLETIDKNFEVITEGDVKVVFYQQYPLVDFLQLLSLTLAKETNGQKFMKLYNEYKPTVSKYELTNSIDYIGRTVYGLNLGNAQGGQNMLANLMGGLFK